MWKWRCFLSEYKNFLIEIFPSAKWENNLNIEHPHALFLYNLALVIGDRKRWGGGGFDELKANVGKLFAHIYRIS